MSAALQSIASNQSSELRCYTMDFAPDDAGNTPSSRLPVAASCTNAVPYNRLTLQLLSAACVTSFFRYTMVLCRISIQLNLFVHLLDSEQANYTQGLRRVSYTDSSQKSSPLSYCTNFYPYIPI